MSTLAKFWERHPETEPSLRHWLTVVKAARWSSTAEVQAAFPKAKVINAERARFEVHGGQYRLIVAFSFRHSIVFIKFIGSHAEYDRVDASSVSRH